MFGEEFDKDRVRILSNIGSLIESPSILRTPDGERKSGTLAKDLSRSKAANSRGARAGRSWRYGQEEGRAILAGNEAASEHRDCCCCTNHSF